MLTSGPVVIVQMPERLDLGGVRVLLQEVEPLLEGHRARIVLDCSQVRYIDSAGVEMMLHCLEEAMKCDGDLKLAALSRVGSHARVDASGACIRSVRNLGRGCT